jgi:hypothetical protein
MSLAPSAAVIQFVLVLISVKQRLIFQAPRHA